MRAPAIRRPAKPIAPAAICLLACIAQAAQAQSWKPDRNVEVVIGLSAGSSQDRTGRTLQKIWQDRGMLGVTSTVTNRVGGNGVVAWTFLSQRAGDAHFVQVASPTILTTHITGATRLTYADFTPLALLGAQYLGVATQAESPLRTGRELFDRLKRDPYSVSFGINGAGSSLHILTGMLVKAAGGDPRKAKVAVFQGAELMTAAIGGHIDCVVTVASNIVPHVQSGKLRMLAVAAPARLSGALASTPTWKEQNLELVVSNWAGVFGPARISAQQVAYWDGILSASVAQPEWKAFIEANLWEAEYMNAADYAKFLRGEDAKLRAALADLGLARQ